MTPPPTPIPVDLSGPNPTGPLGRLTLHERLDVATRLETRLAEHVLRPATAEDGTAPAGLTLTDAERALLERWPEDEMADVVPTV